jgi:S1-C subfamily serine protease/thiol-disulfide isomerase/thioredoxin
MKQKATFDRALLGAAASVLVLASISSTAASAAEDRQPAPAFRSWTDAAGKHTVKATFLGVRDDKVRLKKENGDEVEVPLAKLSEADREAVKTLMGQTPPPKPKEDDEDPFATPAKTEKAPTVQDMAAKVGKGIVFVSTRDRLGAKRALGSGFVIDASGLVATNYHVIKDASSATVRFRDKTEVEVAGYRALDRQHDLAILQLKDPPKDLLALNLQPPGVVKQGDAVVAIGHPGGFEFTVANGIVSAIRKTKEMPDEIRANLGADPDCRWLQITAPSAPGSSGGPLLSSQGDVAGVVAMVVPSQSIGFAIHCEHLADLKKRLSDKPLPLPVPGSFQGPGVSEPAVLEELDKLRRAQEEFKLKLQSVVDNDKREEIAKSENPVPQFMGKFRKLAEGKPGTRLEFEALVTMVRLANDESQGLDEELRWALGRLLQNHSGAEHLGGLMVELCRKPRPEVQAFMRDVVAKSPHRHAKALGCVALGLALGADPRTCGRNEEECVAALDRAVTEFGDVEMGSKPLKEFIAPLLAEKKWLAIGRPAQDIEGKDSAGQSFRLSEYRGKVVLLDFWVDWCPYCRQMYPHERMLLKEHGEKSFAILGVNCEDPERQQRVEAGGAVTWRSWSDGQGGPIARNWNVSGYPTLYLLDPRGKIRSKGNLRGELLTANVKNLVQEAESGLQNDLIESCAVWNYLDDKAADKGWREHAFDDSRWKSGRALFGFGHGDEATAVHFCGKPTANHTTVYFRRQFQVKDPAAVPALTMGLCASDGVAVYLNGREVLRRNLAPAAGDTGVATADDKGLLCQYSELDPKLLRAGANLMAVEVHRRNHLKGTLRFDLALSGQKRRPVEATSASPEKEKSARPQEPSPGKKLVERLPNAKRLASNVATTSWSPDGNRLIVGKMPYGAGLQVLTVKDGKGSLEPLLPTGKDPAWSPSEGRWIAFVEGDRSSINGTVCLMDADGKNLRKVAQGAFPVWAKDGKTLFFCDSAEKKLKSVDAGSPELKVVEVAAMPWSHCPSVAPDGQRISFTAEGELRIVPRGSDKPSLAVKLPTAGHFFHSWSPDSKQIALGSAYGKSAEELGLWVFDIETKKYREVARGPFTMPAWSADGKKLAFDLRMARRHETWVIETKDLDALPWKDAP